MAKRSRNMDAKSFAQQKRKRRQWLTFVRMCRYGVNNFSRNAWLTVAATAVMTITLLIVFATLAARNTLAATVEILRDNVEMSIYLKTDATNEAVATIEKDLRNLSTVTDVKYISPDAGRAAFAENNSSNPDTLDALNQAINKFPPTLRVNLVDVNDTSQLDEFIKTNAVVKENINPNEAPSFQGVRREAIEKIGRWIDFADRSGLVASIVFIAISSLIVFNTIRMAIFNRKDEIEMMKLIGADKSFIRGPFVVEAIVYGFISAILATGLGILGLLSLQGPLAGADVAIGSTIDFTITYIGFILLAMILLGAIIGVMSSLLATRRYLKI